MQKGSSMLEKLSSLPPRIRHRVQDINPETGRQRVDPTTGERLWRYENINVIVYGIMLVIGIPYILVFFVWDEIRAAVSPSYQEARERERLEYMDRIRKRRERYHRQQHDDQG